MQEDKKIIMSVKPELPYAIEEAINRLRINVNFLGKDVRKIMIVSSEPNEGKSFITFSLWKQMAAAGVRTVLIDGDMRNSTLVEKYGIKRSDGQEVKGLSHYLSGDEELDEVLFHTELENGDLLPNAENIINPSLLLDNKKFKELLKALGEQYRYVFVDAPPLGMVSDAERIGNLCDGAILCVRGGSTPRTLVKEAVHQLERAGCPLLGIVLNRVSDSKGGYYNKYYSHGYGRYYSGKNNNGD